MSSHRNLERFAFYYGFSEDVLKRFPLEIENAPEDFSGEINVLRIKQYGRFGNNVHQIFNAILLGRQLCCEVIELFPFVGGPEGATIGDLTFRHHSTDSNQSCPQPTLVGLFYASHSFPSALRDMSPRYAWDTLQRYMRPLFSQTRHAATDMGRTTLVVHFRSGDIFRDGEAHSWYVQPPASFYRKAVDHARSVLGVQDVVLVFEDRANPAIEVTEQFLESEGIPFRVQSSTLSDDLACLLGARHLVASFSTMCEAVGMLSSKLESYFAFRRIDSHEHFHRRPEPLFSYLMKQSRVRTIVISDSDDDYIPALTWSRSPEQLHLIANFPVEKLVLVDNPPEPALDAVNELNIVDPWASQTEAVWLREMLLIERRKNEALRRLVSELRGSTRRRFPVPGRLRRWLASMLSAQSIARRSDP